MYSFIQFCWWGNYSFVSFLKLYTGRFIVTVINRSLLIAKGKTVKLAIKTTAVGIVLYQWRKRGAEQLPDKALGGDTAELTIPRVDLSDKGKYYCDVTNSWNVTVKSHDINLTIYGM